MCPLSQDVPSQKSNGVCAPLKLESYNTANAQDTTPPQHTENNPRWKYVQAPKCVVPVVVCGMLPVAMVEFHRVFATYYGCYLPPQPLSLCPPTTFAQLLSKIQAIKNKFGERPAATSDVDASFDSSTTLAGSGSDGDFEDGRMNDGIFDDAPVDVEAADRVAQANETMRGDKLMFGGTRHDPQFAMGAAMHVNPAEVEASTGFNPSNAPMPPRNHLGAGQATHFGGDVGPMARVGGGGGGGGSAENARFRGGGYGSDAGARSAGGGFGNEAGARFGCGGGRGNPGQRFSEYGSGISSRLGGGGGGSDPGHGQRFGGMIGNYPGQQFGGGDYGGGDLGPDGVIYFGGKVVHNGQYPGFGGGAGMTATGMTLGDYNALYNPTGARDHPARSAARLDSEQWPPYQLRGGVPGGGGPCGGGSGGGFHEQPAMSSAAPGDGAGGGGGSAFRGHAAMPSAAPAASAGSSSSAERGPESSGPGNQGVSGKSFVNIIQWS